MTKRRPSSERRGTKDRRALLTDAAHLAVMLHDLVAANAGMMATVAALQKDVELLRTATAPPIQGRTAWTQMRTHVQLLENAVTGHVSGLREIEAAVDALGGFMSGEPPSRSE